MIDSANTAVVCDPEDDDIGVDDARAVADELAGEESNGSVETPLLDVEDLENPRPPPSFVLRHDDETFYVLLS